MSKSLSSNRSIEEVSILFFSFYYFLLEVRIIVIRSLKLHRRDFYT